MIKSMPKLENLKLTTFIRLFAFYKVPLLWLVRPSIVHYDSEKTVLKIPLNRRTRNHLKVMYFGAMAMGAEAAISLAAILTIQKSGKKVDFIFKDFKAQFLKRAEGDVHFVCDQGLALQALVLKCLESGQRETQTFQCKALVPQIDPNEVVAVFDLTLSVKAR